MVTRSGYAIICIWGVLMIYHPLFTMAKVVQMPQFDMLKICLCLSSIAVVLLAGIMYVRWNLHRAFSNTASLFSCLVFGAFCEYASPSPEGNLHAVALSVLFAGTLAGMLSFVARKWALVVFVPYAVIIFSMSYMEKTLRLAVDAPLVAQIIGASKQDVMQFATMENVLAAVCAVAVILLICLAFIKYTRVTDTGKMLVCYTAALCSLVLGAFASLFPCIARYDSHGIGCYRCICRLHRAFDIAIANNSRFMQLVQSLPSPADMPSSMPLLNDVDDVVCILHVGESLRADRLAINGYYRDTTPWLSRQKRLINFRNCTSISPYTTVATMTILTNARGNVEQKISPELKPSAGCVMDLFAANGFSCYAFFNEISSEGRNEAHEAVFEKLTSMYTRKAKKIYGIGESQKYSPMAQLAQISKTLGETSGKMFLLVNNMGSHMCYTTYDCNRAPFLPADGKMLMRSPQDNPETASLVNNAYDNTVEYTDHYIQKLLEGLAGRPFIYLYIGDHGDPLGDGGLWLRGTISGDYHQTQWCKVPFFIVYSPEFEKLHPEIHRAIRNLADNSSMPVAHEHIFHTLLGLFGVKTPYYDAALDLCTPCPTPYLGPSPERDGQAADGRVWK